MRPSTGFLRNFTCVLPGAPTDKLKGFITQCVMHFVQVVHPRTASYQLFYYKQ